MTIKRRDFALALAGLALAKNSVSQPSPMRLPKCLNTGPNVAVDIDAHCHVFNGSDLQVELFLTLVASSDFSGLLKKVVQLLAKPLQRSVWAHAPKAGVELDKLKKFPSDARLKKNAAEILTPVYESLARETTANYSEAFAEELSTQEGQAFLDAYKAYLRSMIARSPGAADATLLLQQSEFERLRQPEGLVQQLEREKSLSQYSIASVFTFIRDFYAYRFEHCYYLLRNYGCEHGAIQLIAPALVDYDYPLGAGQSPPPSSLTDQFKVMERICAIFQGRVLPYLAFDPWRIAQGNDLEPFKAAQEYVSRGAAIGFKLYPPMGFAPFANVDLKPPPGSWPKAANFAKSLDDALGQLWDFSLALDAPVIAHGGMSNAPFADRVALGSPSNWTKLFQDRRYSSARVLFGHFGGEDLLNKGGWPAGFLDLVSVYPNAYGDIAYFEQVLSSSTEKKLRTELAGFIKQKNAADKMLYGSDWVMLAIEAHAELYFEKMHDILSDETLFDKAVAAKVFGLNAQQFLGLHPGQKTRSRLEAFYKQQNIDAAWLTLIS